MSKTEKTSPTAPSNQPDARRRALLKGAIKGVAIGAPTIITLASGTAWAQSVPCFSRVYNGYVVANGGKVYSSSPPSDGPTPPSNRVAKMQISQMCWDSGATTPYANLI